MPESHHFFEVREDAFDHGGFEASARSRPRLGAVCVLAGPSRAGAGRRVARGSRGPRSLVGDHDGRPGVPCSRSASGPRCGVMVGCRSHAQLLPRGKTSKGAKSPWLIRDGTSGRGSQ
jgi:hypothetical protein